MPTRDQILQAGVNAQYFDAGAAVFFVQAAANWNTTGFSATAFPTKIDDIVNLTGAAIGTAVTANGWRNVGYTGGIQVSRNRTTVDLDADQASPVLTLHDKWEAQVVTTILENSPENRADFMYTSSDGVQTVNGGAAVQYRQDFGSPGTITYRRVAVLHPTPAGALVATVFTKATVAMTQGQKYERTGRSEMQITANCFPDDRISDVQRRVGTILYTADGFLT